MTKSPHEIELMAEAGRLLASVFEHLDTVALAGLSTMAVNDMVDDLIVGRANIIHERGEHGWRAGKDD